MLSLLWVRGKDDTSFHVERYRPDVTGGGFLQRTPSLAPIRLIILPGVIAFRE
jgi:hypothetical protein